MDDTAIKIRQLIDDLNSYTELYDKGTPAITDKAWDNMYFNLQELERTYNIIYPDSPTQSITYEVKSKLDKVVHDEPPMLSLDKTKNDDDIQDFVKGHDWFGMFKMDGLSCRLVYRNGNLIQASTRGNGLVGEDITHNAMVISNIPKSIPYLGEFIVDGEIICDLETFDAEFKDTFANPRNMAAGSIRQLSSKECASRKLSFVAWDLIKGYKDIDFNFHRLEELDYMGFDTVPRVGDAETIEDAINILDRMEEHKLYPTDGYVFKFESKKYGESLGRTEHHWNNAIAFKFYDEEYETELLDIEWGMGRTGILTPVAVFKPVDTDGSILERASLHNLSIMRKILGDYPEKNQRIWVVKQNQIIPQVSRAEKNNAPHNYILENCVCNTCPVCGEPTEIIESESGVLNVYCGNPSCHGQLINQLDHFCGTKGLDIKGLSVKTLEKLIEHNFVKEIQDIFELEFYSGQWKRLSGFGEKSVEKILANIKATRQNCELWRFISALGISLVGTTCAKNFAKHFKTWEDFYNHIEEGFLDIEGIGYEINKSLTNKNNYKLAEKILPYFTIVNSLYKDKSGADSAVEGLTIVITGKLHNYKRDELKSIIESAGGKVTGSVSTKTDILINNDNTSTTAKNKKAQELGIPVLTEEEFIEKYLTS